MKIALAIVFLSAATISVQAQETKEMDTLPPIHYSKTDGTFPTVSEFGQIDAVLKTASMWCVTALAQNYGAPEEWVQKTILTNGSPQVTEDRYTCLGLALDILANHKQLPPGIKFWVQREKESLNADEPPTAQK